MESVGLFQHLSLAFEIDLDIDVGGVDERHDRAMHE